MSKQKLYEPCPVCPTCGAAFVSHGWEMTTCVGFFSPFGHDHDGNCMGRDYTCSAGHVTTLSIVRRCPADGCDWRGKTECFCCDRFVDEWPAVAMAPVEGSESKERGR